MATKRKTVSRTRRPSSKPTRFSSFKRFIKTISVSAITSFGIASCALNPQLRDWDVVDALISQFEWPQQTQSASAVHDSGAYVQTSFAQCREFFPQNKPPIVPAAQGQRELCFSAFALLHHAGAKTPVFVAQRLNKQMLTQARHVQRVDRFYAEARLPKAERAELDDYRGSGYSRGHMAPAGDMHNNDAMAQSFSLANMVPQNQRHNAGAWSKIENDTRKYVMRAQGDVYVFTGPVYTADAKTIGKGQVAIPDFLYKLVYDATTQRSWVHWQQHSADTKASAPISYEEFVHRTGLHLLPLVETK